MEGPDTGAAEPDSVSAAESRPDDCSPFSITAVNCSSERTVFTEDENDGGWISTDTTVDVER